MTYIPAIKTQLQLITDISNGIKANGANEITGNLLGQLLADIVGSLVNKIDNVNLLGLANYDTTRAYKGGSVGECCIKDGNLLQCKVDTQGVFDASKWKVILGVESLTLSALQAKIVAAELSSGVVYYISDRSIYLPAKSSSIIDKNGVKVITVPRYREFDTNGNVIKPWSKIEASTVVVNRVVAYKGQCYNRTTTLDNITSPDANSDYTLIPSSNASVYKVEQFSVEFDVINDQVVGFKDSYNNDVKLTKQLLDDLGISDSGLNSMLRIGDPVVTGNVIHGGYVSVFESAVLLKDCVALPGSKCIWDNTSSDSSLVSRVTFYPGCVFELNTMRSGSVLSNSRFYEGSVFANKVIDTDVTVNNYTCGVNFSDAITIPIDMLVNKTMLPYYNDVTVDISIGSITDHILHLQSVSYAGTIKIQSIATSAIRDLDIDFRGWPITLWCFGVGITFESNSDIGSSNLYFGAADTKTPFINMLAYNGYITFVKDFFDRWSVVTSKSIL